MLLARPFPKKQAAPVRRRYIAIAYVAIFIVLGAALLLQTPRELRGVWQTDGYGRVIEIGRYRIAVYDITQSTCALSFQTRASRLFLSQWHLKVGEDRATMRIRARQDPHLIRANRLSDLPNRCLAQQPATPAEVFAAFTEGMDTHYAFFDRYNVNWPVRVTLARDKISLDMTENDLFEIMAHMLDGIADGHVYLRGDPGGLERVILPGRSQIAKEVLRQRKSGQLPDDFRFMRTYWNEWVLWDILQGQGTLQANGLVAWGKLADGTGYLAIRRLHGFARADNQAMAALEQAMEKAMREFALAGTDSIILDLAANPGGSDHFVQAVAGRFTNTPFVAYEKYAADARAPIHTTATVTPSNGTRFTGPVYMLTSELTGSAAEILTIAMRQIPTVVHMGEVTGGSLSDVLDRTLPNGWTIGISNEVYRDPDGQSWEGRGIPPDHRLQVFDPQNLTAGHSAAIREIQRFAAARQKE